MLCRLYASHDFVSTLSKLLTYLCVCSQPARLPFLVLLASKRQIFNVISMKNLQLLSDKFRTDDVFYCRCTIADKQCLIIWVNGAILKRGLYRNVIFVTIFQFDIEIFNIFYSSFLARISEGCYAGFYMLKKIHLQKIGNVRKIKFK